MGCINVDVSLSHFSDPLASGLRCGMLFKVDKISADLRALLCCSDGGVGWWLVV